MIFYEREESSLKESRHVADIDFQHRFALLDWNDLIWGVEYRSNHDYFDNSSLHASTVKPSSRNVQLFGAFGRSPQQHLSIPSAISPWKNIDMDVLFRYVGASTVASAFGKIQIKDYISMGIRLAWHPTNNLELSLVGQNLLAEKHLEYRQEFLTTATEIDRGMYGKVTWHF